MWVIAKMIFCAVMKNYHERQQMAEARYVEELKAGIHDPEKLRWLKWASFLQFSAPLWVAWFYPEKVAEFLRNLDMFPDWYVQIYLTMNATIWGVAVGSDLVTKVIKNYKRANQVGGQYDPDANEVYDPRRPGN